MIYPASTAFRAALDTRGRLIGLDVGKRTIGLATCDAGWSFATPLETIARTKFTPDLAKLRAVIARERVVGLVVGLPLNMDASDSKQTQSVREFARSVDQHLQMPMLLWDERWSTVAVERAMIDADLSRARRHELVDKLAAAHILQGAIDALMTATL